MNPAENPPRSDRGAGCRTASFRIPVSFQAKKGLILLDQIRVVDKNWLARKLGRLQPAKLSLTLKVLGGLFAP